MSCYFACFATIPVPTYWGSSQAGLKSAATLLHGPIGNRSTSISRIDRPVSSSTTCALRSREPTHLHRDAESCRKVFTCKSGPSRSRAADRPSTCSPFLCALWRRQHRRSNSVHEDVGRSVREQCLCVSPLREDTRLRPELETAGFERHDVYARDVRGRA